MRTDSILPRQAGGRGLLEIRLTVEAEKRALNDYIKHRPGNSCQLTMLCILRKMRTDSILPRQAGGRGLLEIRLTVEAEKRALNDYIKHSTEHALKAVSDEDCSK